MRTSAMQGLLPTNYVSQQHVCSPVPRSVTTVCYCLSQLLHDGLHWLDVPERVKYKMA